MDFFLTPLYFLKKRPEAERMDVVMVFRNYPSRPVENYVTKMISIFPLPASIYLKPRQSLNV